MKPFTDLTGKRIGKLVVLSREPNVGRRLRWKCQCDCGRTKVMWACNLHNKASKSCGCEWSKPLQKNPSWRGHGEIGMRRYKEIKRGASERNHLFSISIQYLWKLFLEQSRQCALSHLPLDIRTTASLDRIDNNRGYVNGNVQWVHKDINFMKQDLSQAEFIHYCKLVSKAYEP